MNAVPVGRTAEWLIRWSFPLVAAFGVMCSVSAMVLAVFHYFAGPIGVELSLTPTRVSLAISIYLGVLIFAMPMAGAVADRIGSGWTIITSGLLYGASLLWISASASTAELYLSFGAAAFFGAGASAVAYARAIVHRFDRLRGLALGITMSGGGLAGMLLPLIVQPVVLNHGWRSGMVALAVLASCIHLIGGWLARDSAAHRSSARAHDSGYAVREAATTQAFWLLTATFVVFGAVIAAVTAHLSAIWRGLGLDLADVLTFQFVMGAAALLGRVLGGAMMDWIPAKYVGAGAAIAGAIGLLMLGFVHDNDATLMIAAAAIGFCTGAESDVVSFLSAQLFGRRNFGRIYGVFASAFLAGAAIGPFLFAVSTSTFGYARLLGSCALALGFSALTLSLLVAPQQAVTAHKTP